jgi:hydrogenase/urease accessory protein HupE
MDRAVANPPLDRCPAFLNDYQTEVRPVFNKFRFPGLAVLWIFSALAVQAHDPGLSAVLFQVKSDGLHADLSMAWADAKLVAPLLAAGPAIPAAALPQLQEFAANAFEVDGNGRRISPEKIRVQADDSRAIHFLITFPGEMTSHLSVRSAQISRLSRGHRQYLALRGERGELLAERMLDAGHDAFEQTWQGAARADNPPHSFASFLFLGVGHILTGYDHICFLLGLLVVGGGLRDVLKIITAFTLAHSVTLALTVLGVIQFSPRIVEPLIAVSIVYVGVENILRRNNLRRRWLLSFGFGLIHGCGFAAALRELNIGAGGGGIALPLLSFNLGVELGQLAIAAIALPIIWKLKSQPSFLPRFAPACSMLVSLAGAYWLVQRVWFS